MSALDSAADDTAAKAETGGASAGSAGGRKRGAERGGISERVLEGSYFSLDAKGAVSAWSKAAEETFGVVRSEVAGEPIAEALGGSADVDIEGLLAGSAPAWSGRIDAVGPESRPLKVELGVMPIRLADGYGVSALLQDASKQRGTTAERDRLRKRHADALALIEAAFEDGGQSVPAADGDGARVVGLLGIFATDSAGKTADDGKAAKKPSKAAGPTRAEGADELERELEEVRTELARVEAGTDELRSTAERAAEETEAARREADEAREALDEARREAEEAAALRTRIEETAAELEAAKTEVRKLRDQADERERLDAGEKAALGAELDTARTELKAEVKRLHAEVERLAREAHEARTEGEASARKAERLAADVERLAGERGEAGGEVDRLRGELEAAHAEFEGARTEAEGLRAELENLGRASESAGSEARSEIEAARAEAERAAAELEAARAELETARTEGEGAHAETEGIRGELEAARAQVEELEVASEKAAAAARAEREAAQGEVEGAHAEAESARNEVETARAELEAARGEAEATRTELDAARVEVESARAESESARAEAETARTDAERVRAEIEGQRPDVDALRAELDAARTEAQSAREDAQAAGAELESARAELDAARSDGEGANAQVETAQAETQGLRAELDAARAELETARAEAETARADADRIRAEIEGQAPDVDALRAELDAARAEAQAARTEAEEARASTAEATAKLEALESSADEARRDASEARAQLRSVESGAEAPTGTSGELDELRRQAERFRGVFETSPVGTALAEPDGRFVHVNRAMCDALGYSVDEMLAIEPAEIVHPDDQAYARATAERLVAGDAGPAREERRYLHAEGRVVSMFETMSLVRGPAGEPLMFAFQLEPVPEPDSAAKERAVDADVRAERLPHRLEVDPLVDEDPLSIDGEESGITPDAIRAALEEDRFVLFCQPVVDLETEQFDYYELLLRLRDTESDSILLPEAFMDAAREGGLRRAIDHWVVARAVKLIDENTRAGRTSKLEVNIAAESIADPELPNAIERELAAVEIDPKLLVLSVSETAAVEQLMPTRRLVERLGELGCSVALQQFGSTFGSFRQLDDLPVDYLKLDADLTVTLRESRPAQLVVKAIVEVARAGSKQTIAGFVSDDETLLVLRRLGVDGAQGYRVGRPRPITEVWPPLRKTEQPAA